MRQPTGPVTTVQPYHLYALEVARQHFQAQVDAMAKEDPMNYDVEFPASFVESITELERLIPELTHKLDVKAAAHSDMAELYRKEKERADRLAAQLAAASINEASLVQDCIDAAWRETDLRAQLAAAQSRLAEIEAQEPTSANLLPTILFDGYTVYKEADEVIGGLIPEHVSAVLDVVVRHARNECARPVPPAAQTVAPAVDKSAIRQAIARAWCHPLNSHKDMDSVLVEAAVDQVVELLASRQPAAQGVDAVEASHPNCNYAGWNGRLCSKCGNVHNQVPPTYLSGKADTAQQEPRHD